MAPLISTIYHSTLARDPEAVKRLPSGQAWLESVMRAMPMAYNKCIASSSSRPHKLCGEA